MRQIKQIVIHHSAGPKSETVKDVNIWHKVRNWGTTVVPIYAPIDSLGYYVQYHYYVDRNGKIWNTRKDDEIGWHAGVWEVNKTSLAICIAGNFNIEKPTESQKNAVRWLLCKLLGEYKLSMANVKMHRDFKKTDCPGKNITADCIKNIFLI